MNKDKPLITVAIPTYKRPKYLRQALDSAVKQNPSDISYDIIVVNNDPDTDMSALEQEYRSAPVPIRFYTNDHNLGMLGNVNRCVELSEGKYIAFLHDDDLLMPDYMKNAADAIRQYPQTAAIIPRRYLLFETDINAGISKLEKKRKKKSFLKNIFIARQFRRNKNIEINIYDNVLACQNCYGAPTCGALYMKEKVKENGLFFPEGTYSWDFISFRKLNEHEQIIIMDKPTAVYRMTVGLSLTALVQYQSYIEFDRFMTSYQGNKKAERFVNKYLREIRFINFRRLSKGAVDMLNKNHIDYVTSPGSKLKYYCFMFSRLRYWSSHRLDVEVPITKKAVAILKESGIWRKGE